MILICHDIDILYIHTHLYNIGTCRRARVVARLAHLAAAVRAHAARALPGCVLAAHLFRILGFGVEEKIC